ncbi:MAG: SigB/SigF/SigG family RNA polymerase sigma factor [Acidimicrobiales bacterium]
MPSERPGANASDRDRLFEAFAADPSETNRNAIVESFVPLAEYFAARYRDRGAESADLRQVAMLALVKAVDRFDPSIGVQFSTFAGRTIDGELKRYFRDATWSVHVPRSLQERSLHVRAVVDELALRLGASPTVDQIAAETGLDTDAVLEALDVQRSYRASSIDSAASSADEAPRATPPALTTTDVDVDRFDTKMAISGLLETLPPREREILELRFAGSLTQSEIAERVGVSQMHVSRLIRRSLETLREQIGPGTTGLGRG